MLRLISLSLILIAALLAAGLLAGRNGVTEPPAAAVSRDIGTLAASLADQFAVEPATDEATAPAMPAAAPTNADGPQAPDGGTDLRPTPITATYLPPRSDKLISTRNGLIFADPASVFAPENRIAPPSPGADHDQPPSEPPPLWRVTASRLNVRSGPNADAAVIGALDRSATVSVLTPDDPEWVRIRAAERGLEGYVARRFLARTDN